MQTLKAPRTKRPEKFQGGGGFRLIRWDTGKIDDQPVTNRRYSRLTVGATAPCQALWDSDKFRLGIDSPMSNKDRASGINGETAFFIHTMIHVPFRHDVELSIFCISRYIIEQAINEPCINTLLRRRRMKLLSWGSILDRDTDGDCYQRAVDLKGPPSFYRTIVSGRLTSA